MSRHYTEHHLTQAIYHLACAALEERDDKRQENADTLNEARKLMLKVRDANQKGGDTTGTQ